MPTKTEKCDLHIKDFGKDLKTAAKICAVQMGIPLRSFIMDAVAHYVQQQQHPPETQHANHETEQHNTGNVG